MFLFRRDDSEGVFATRPKSADDFVLPKVAKLFCMGSGSDGLQQTETVETIVKLSGKTTPSILYLGTATYDLPEPRQRQTDGFRQLGCSISELELVCHAPSESEVQLAFVGIDIVIVSGGNTLYAVDRWKQMGVDVCLARCLERGVVLAGGSAGAVCWFDAGHSDSMDPETYKEKMMKSVDVGSDESSKEPLSDAEKKSWKYIRVPGLGFLPGLCCPHYDMTQSNGVCRATDFDEMLLQHTGEHGLGIDHFAALIIEGEHFRVFSVKGKTGSNRSGVFSPGEGVPAVWVKHRDGDTMSTYLVPAQGKIADLLHPATSINDDPCVAVCRWENPSRFPERSAGLKMCCFR